MTRDDKHSAFSWRAHPAREHLGRAVAGIVCMLGLATLAAILMQSLWWAFVALAILLLALNRFFFASTFVLDEQGVTARYPLTSQRLEWADLRVFERGREAGLLRTRTRVSRWTGGGAMHILFGRHRERVCELIGARLGGGQPWAC